jgi:Xaa-Pro dipeptidase
MQHLINKVPAAELGSRLTKLCETMDRDHPEWRIAIITSKANLYYYTGTIQNASLIIERGKSAVLWVFRSFERATLESLFPDIRPMKSFKDIAAEHSTLPETVWLETGSTTLEWYQRLTKYLPFKQIKPLDKTLERVRQVKSPYERGLMRISGRIHEKVMHERIPPMLREGMTEAELATKILAALLEEGFQGISRFNMENVDVLAGHICFGDSVLYPSVFNGPSGCPGVCPASPVLGSRTNRLRYGDLIYIDAGCAFEGYNTDKTLVFSFGKTPDSEVLKLHRQCMEIHDRTADLLVPGNTPSNIFQAVIKDVPDDFLPDFMEYGGKYPKFLGHSIGLVVDERPPIAPGFDEPLEEGMFFAIEPKKGLPGIGMVGTENTFEIKKDGAVSITGRSDGIIVV